MADNSFQIVARLDINKSAKLIKTDIKTLEKIIQSDKNARLKIIAGLDIAKSKNLIQSQLATITNQANAPTIKVGVDVGNQNAVQNISVGLKDVQVQAQRTANTVKKVTTNMMASDISDKAVKEFQKSFKIVGKNAQETKDVFKGLFAELNNAWYAGDVEHYNNVIDEIYNTASKATRAIGIGAKETKAVIDEIRGELSDGSKVSISSNVKSELDYIIGEANSVKKVLDTVYGVGKWSYQKNGIGADVAFQAGNESKEIQGYANAIVDAYERIEKAKSKVPNDIFDYMGGAKSAKDEIDNQVKSIMNLSDAYTDASGTQHSYIEGLGWFENIDDINTDIQQTTKSIDEQTKATQKLKAVSESITYDENGQQISRTSVYDDNGFTKTSRFDENDELTSFTISENFDKMAKNAARAEAEVTKLTTKLNKIQSGYSDKNASQAITDSGHIDNLAKQYGIVENAINQVKTADSNTFAVLKANAEQEISKLQDLVIEYKNAEYAATSLRKKDIGTIKTNQQNDLSKFIGQVSSTNVFSAMKSDIEALSVSLSKVTDSESLTAYLNQLDNAKTKFEALKSLSTTIESNLTKLQTLQNQAVFKNNASNTEVIKLKADINELIGKYQNLLTLLQSNPTPDGLKVVETELTKLNSCFSDTQDSAKDLQTALAQTNGQDKLIQKTNLLITRIEAYRSANTKAEKSYGNLFDDMLSELRSGSLDNIGVDRVSKQFQSLRQEISLTGKTGKTFWEKLKEQAEKFSSWMTLTGFISSAWRDLQKMVTNVIEIDSAMTNLKKVTDETETSYTRFLKNSTKEAQNLHATVTDLIEQVATWSKLGFSLQDSENLAKISMIYSKVGEVDNTTAVSDLVTVMKANFAFVYRNMHIKNI